MIFKPIFNQGIEPYKYYHFVSGSLVGVYGISTLVGYFIQNTFYAYVCVRK